MAARIAPKNAVLQAKVAVYTDARRTLTFAYGNNRRKLFTEDEDRFLFCTTAELGYGNWKQLQTAVKRCEAFRFDWLVRSRTPGELGRRVDVLIRLVQQERQEE